MKFIVKTNFNHGRYRSYLGKIRLQKNLPTQKICQTTITIINKIVKKLSDNLICNRMVIFCRLYFIRKFCQIKYRFKSDIVKLKKTLNCKF